jgi:hypothetical protein
MSQPQEPRRSDAANITMLVLGSLSLVLGGIIWLASRTSYADCHVLGGIGQLIDPHQCAVAGDVHTGGIVLMVAGLVLVIIGGVRK